MVTTVLASKHFPEHFRQTRRLRLVDGQQIPSDIPLHVVWGDKDRIARARTSRHTDQLFAYHDRNEVHDPALVAYGARVRARLAATAPPSPAESEA